MNVFANVGAKFVLDTRAYDSRGQPLFLILVFASCIRTFFVCLDAFFECLIISSAWETFFYHCIQLL